MSSDKQNGNISLTEEFTPESGSKRSGQTPLEKTAQQLLTMDEELVYQIASKAYQEAKAKGTLVSELRESDPRITFHTKTGKPDVMWVPSRWREDPGPIGKLFFVLARKFGITVCLLNYTGTLRPPAEDDFIDGVLVGIYDDDTRLNIRHSNSKFEDGRRWVRAQQAVKYFNLEENKLSPTLLKRNNLFFGNNPGEERVIKEKAFPVVPYSKQLNAYIAEEEWEDKLRKMLITLIRLTWIFLKEKVLKHMIEDVIISFDDYAKAHLGKTIVIDSGRRGKQRIEVTKYLAMPNMSNVITKGEYRLIKKVFSPVFKDPAYRRSDLWISTLCSVGFTKIRDQLEANRKAKIDCLTAFATFTTKRLRRIRDIVPESANKKKADVNLTDLSHFVKKTEYKREFAQHWADFKIGEAIVFEQALGLDPKISRDELVGFIERAINEEEHEIINVAPSDILELLETDRETIARNLAEELAEAHIMPKDCSEESLDSVSKVAEKVKENQRLDRLGNLDQDHYNLLPTTAKRAITELNRGEITFEKAFSTLDQICIVIQHGVQNPEAIERIQLLMNRSKSNPIKAPQESARRQISQAKKSARQVQKGPAGKKK